MSPTSRTNIVHSQLIQLIALQATANAPAQATLHSSFVLLLEQGLCALLREMATPPDGASNQGGLVALLDEVDQDVSRTALVSSIRNGIRDPQHWLHHWSVARQQCFQPAGVDYQDAGATLIPMVDREFSRQPKDCVSWLQGFADLVFGSRSLNNYD
ncbi:hypothetical protein [Reinekea sp.]|jgi:hypothetical protein|uniref:hypothetical protein n=1 Tax=Reinekea sp. TaxID=1970455 RepID=UPI002A7F9B6A|nr:hypothetical protein [Reinekea sp.]